MFRRVFLVCLTLSYANSTLVFEDTNGYLENSLKSNNKPGRVKREWIWNRMTVPENSHVLPNCIGKIKSTAADNSQSVIYKITGEGADTLFQVNETAGDIYVIKTLNREEKSQYNLTAKVLDKKTGKELDKSSAFVILVSDVNDNAPVFSQTVYQATIPENSPKGKSVIQVSAKDADDPTVWTHAKIEYHLYNGSEYFQIHPETGRIDTKPYTFDREKTPSYIIIVEARDQAGSATGYLSSKATVIISLSDVNDNQPAFVNDSFTCTIEESIPAGSEICRVTAVDPDEPQNANTAYRFAQDNMDSTFSIKTDPETKQGIITTKKPLDYEKQKEYRFSVNAKDSALPPQYPESPSSRARVTVFVKDVDEPPVFQPPFIFQVSENASLGGVGAVKAKDPDMPQKSIKYSIKSTHGTGDFFSITQDGTIVLSKTLDRETHTWHNITVLAKEYDNTNIYGKTGSSMIAINVLDINDNAPEFAYKYEPFVCENDQPGKLIQIISAVDKDELIPGTSFTFRLHHDENNFTLQNNYDMTANITLQQAAFKRETLEEYLLPIIISDNGNPPLSSTNTLTIKVCKCNAEGGCDNFLALRTGVGIQALIAILLCLLTIIVIVLLLALYRRRRKHAVDDLGKSTAELFDEYVRYDEEGGGEMDTNSYDVSVLNSVRRNGLRPMKGAQPDISLYSEVQKPSGNADMALMIEIKKDEADYDKDGLPYDTLHIYDFEGSDSVAESLSSLQTWSSDSDQDYDFLNDWGPRFTMLAELYGSQPLKDHPLC
ncbi:cadherin-5 [Protopterus annectens]|uniref:cadherin-5 n=1 Tax=Protopterus annectens TaxID=7888 RepID=UPI001CFADA46|nr:cadherin-5 [Protopterus annectens]XP_043937754.1 cadherin-5 [Protopterus annectens]